MKKTLRFALCLLLTAALGLGCAAGALVYDPPAGDDSGEEETIPQYGKSLSGTIGAGQFVEFTTVASKLETDEELGYYAGELTVETTGPIVIEAGGELQIGTLAVGGSEARPLIKGALSADTPLIVVKAGGRLELQCVDFELSGTGVLIEQQAGGIVSLTSTSLPEGAGASWAGPVVDNAGNQPDDIYLEAGTPLTAELLPATLNYEVMRDGRPSDEDVPVAWNLEGLAGQTTGEADVAGVFLDENGEPLASAQPLKLHVSWYEPGKLAVTDASWTGGEAVTVALFLDKLPEEVSTNNIWGETSPDGRTWTAFATEEFEVKGDEEKGYSAVFYLYDDNEPRYFRLAATDWYETMSWYSDGFYLPTEEDSNEDQGGNRGGSVSLLPPPREPEHSPEPTPEPAPEPTPEPTLEPTPTPTPTPLPTPEPPQEPQPPVLDMTASEQTVPPEPEESEDPEETEQPQIPEETPSEPEPPSPPADDVEIEAPELPGLAPDSGMSTGEKVALAAAGVAVCAGVVMAVAGVGPFRRKK